MYTVVLMAALSGGNASPAWHPRGGVVSGYCSTVGVDTSGPAYGGGCLGTWGGFSGAGPGSYGYSGWGGWGLNGNMTVYSGPDGYGYGTGVGRGGMGTSFQCHGCYGCYGGWACYGMPNQPSDDHVYAPAHGTSEAPPILPQKSILNPGAVPPPVRTPNPAPLPKGGAGAIEETKARGVIHIELPEDAKLYVDGQLMRSTTGKRVFQTPALAVGQNYFYDLRIEIQRQGRTVADTQRVLITPGEETSVAFRDPSARTNVVAGR